MVSFSKASPTLFFVSMIGAHVVSGHTAIKGEDNANFAAELKNLRASQKKGGKSRKSASSNELTGLDDGSLSGTYSLVLEDGPNQGFGIGLVDFDGEGGLEGSLVISAPIPNPNPESPFDRTRLTTAVEGTYSLESDGRGNGALSLVDLSLDEPISLFVTERQGTDVEKIAGNFLDSSPFIPSSLVVFELKQRRPNGFDASSLQGVYSWVIVAGTHSTQATILVTFDGEGSHTGNFVANTPDANNPGSRSAGAFDFSGVYSVDDEGFVEFNLNAVIAPGPISLFADLVITESTGSSASRLAGVFRTNSLLLAPGSMVSNSLTYLGPAVSTTQTE